VTAASGTVRRMSFPLGYGETVPKSDQATPADYANLGLAPGAPAGEVKKAYRRLARENHPDVTGGDKRREADFKRISNAYERIIRAPLSPAPVPAAAPRPVVYRAAEPITLSTLAKGDRVWISAAAVRVDLDRRCFIDPMARLRPYETTDSPIRVDVSRDGYRITLSSTLRVAWETEETPVGLAVAKVKIIPPSTATKVRSAEYSLMPPQLISSTLRRARDGDVYVPIDAIVVQESSVLIDLDAVFVKSPSHHAPVRISRRGEAWYVRADGRMTDWTGRRHKPGPNMVKADSAQIGNTLIGSRLATSA
jgi:DnaJ domain